MEILMDTVARLARMVLNVLIIWQSLGLGRMGNFGAGEAVGNGD